MKIMRTLASPGWRPFTTLGALILVFAFIDAGSGTIFSVGTAFSVLQGFSTIGPIALGLGLTMIVREFDISIPGIFSLAGCVAVILGNDSAVLGLLAAIALGGLAGLVQGAIMVRLRLGSVAVSLGGLLVFGGLAYVVTGNRSIPFTNMDVALGVNDPILGVFSARSLTAIALFLLGAVVVRFTRIGRDVVATGSNREGALVAGVRVGAIVVGVFAVSGFLAAGSGSLLSFGLATASPTGLAEVLVPAAAAAILGGVSLSGGTGRPLGIACGVLVLALLRSGLTALGVSPYVHEVATGAILLTVAILDGPELVQRWWRVRRTLRVR